MGGHGGVSGGDPSTIADGGAGLKRAGTAVGGRSAGFSQGGSGCLDCGSPELAAAVARFAAAGGQLSHDLGTQLGAAALLATNASADLDHATGGHG